MYGAGVPPSSLDIPDRLRNLHDSSFVTVGLSTQPLGIVHSSQHGNVVRVASLGIPPQWWQLALLLHRIFLPPPVVCISLSSPWTTFVMASSEMACVYAALILHDESISITVRLLLRRL